MAAVAFSEETVRGLAALQRLGGEAVGAIATVVFTVLRDTSGEQSASALLASQAALSGLQTGDAGEKAVKQGYASLLSLALDGARLGNGSGALRDALEEYFDDAGFLAPFLVQYDKALASVRYALQQSSWHLPHVVDCEWRLDYVVRDSALATYDQPCYFVSLQTEQPRRYHATAVATDSAKPVVAADASPFQSVDFCCSLEQMEDLVDRLKDACKQAERLSALS